MSDYERCKHCDEPISVGMSGEYVHEDSDQRVCELAEPHSTAPAEGKPSDDPWKGERSAKTKWVLDGLVDAVRKGKETAHWLTMAENLDNGRNANGHRFGCLTGKGGPCTC